MPAQFVPSRISHLIGLQLRLAGPQPVGFRSNSLTNGRVSVTTTGNTWRTSHLIACSCANLRVRLRNDYAGGWGETPNTDSLQIKASLEYPLGSILPVF